MKTSKEIAALFEVFLPSQFLGVESILGSLEPGKTANLVLANGEIFGEKTEAQKVFVDGILFPIEKREKVEQK